jgi:hypothetical protein
LHVLLVIPKVKTNVTWLAANSPIDTLIASSFLAAQTGLCCINLPDSVLNISWQSAAVIIGGTKLLAAKNTELNENEQHEEHCV